MEQITKIISLFVNETNQIEVNYIKEYTDERGYLKEMREGRVWSPTDDIASDTLSGAHPDVKKLAATYWTPEVVTAYSANLIAQANEERDKQQATLDEAAAKKLEVEAAHAKDLEDAKARELAAQEAKALAEKAEAEAKAAKELADKATAELEEANRRNAEALAVKKAAEEVAAREVELEAKWLAEQRRRKAEIPDAIDQAIADKKAFDDAVAAAVAAQLVPVEVAA